MDTFLFLFFSLLTLLGAFSVVVSKNAVTGVMSMIVSFIGISGLFLLLEAYLLAVLQIFVYAGAVMVLFLFVVMLLNIEDVSRPKADLKTVIAGTAGALGLAGLFVYLFGFSDLAHTFVSTREPICALPLAGNPLGFAASAKAYGYRLFTQYLLVVQVVGLLLLAAVVGVVYLGKSSSHDS